MAKLNEEALQNMFLVDDLVRRDKEMRETLEAMRRESQVHQCEAKALMQRNDEMKNAFAVLLDRFQDFVNNNEQQQEKLRGTIKRLSVENQRIKVNHQIEIKDVQDKGIRIDRREMDEAER